MKDLTDFLKSTHLLTEEQVAFVISKGQIRKLKPSTNISKPHKVPNEIAFITKGVFRIFYLGDEGDDITKFFIDEKNFIVDIANYLSQKPSTDFIQAVTNSEIVVFSREDLQIIDTKLANWHKIVTQLVTESFLTKLHVISPMLHENATVRYQNFNKNFPSIANKIPLSFIASFLGITQQSLSRIRKNLA
jgi:CRP-like cAMP-binding protein